MLAGRLPVAERLFIENVVVPALVPGTLVSIPVPVLGITGSEVVSVNNPIGAGISVTAWANGPDEIQVQLIANVGYGGGALNFTFYVVVV